MKHTIEDAPGCQAKVRLSFDATEVDRAFDKVYQELNTRGQVRGFRPGRVPRALLLRHFGADSIAESVWYDLLKDNLEEAVGDLETVGEPDFGEPSESGIEEGKPLDVEFTVTLASRADLGDVSGVTIYRPETEPTEDEIQGVLRELAESNAVETDTDRNTVGAGDAVTVSIAVSVEGEERPAEAAEQSVVAGREGLVPPIGEKLPGRMLEQSFELEFTYPEDYPDGGVAGKAAKAEVVVKEIRDRRVPAIDDELAQLVDAEKFATLADLEAEIRRQTQAERAEYSRHEMELQMVKALRDVSTVEVAEELVLHLAVENVQDTIRRFADEGVAREDIESVLGVEAGQLNQFELFRARQTLEVDALLAGVAKQHELEVTEEEIESAVQLYAEENGLDADTVRQAQVLQPEFEDRLLQNLRRRKTFDTLFTAVDLQDIAVEEYRKIRDDLLRPKPKEEPEAPSETAAAEPETQSEAAADAGRPAEAVQTDAEGETEAEAEQEDQTTAP